MYEIDKPKVFASKDAIPEELRAEFEYFESHMMFKVRIYLTIYERKPLKKHTFFLKILERLMKILKTNVSKNY